MAERGVGRIAFVGLRNAERHDDDRKLNSRWGTRPQDLEHCGSGAAPDDRWWPHHGKDHTRGSKTTLGANGVFVVLQDTLTRGEQTLADAGNHDAVLDLRRRWQMIMKKDVSREIEELMGRKVIGFMSDNHMDPDLAVEVLVLEPLPRADAH